MSNSNKMVFIANASKDRIEWRVMNNACKSMQYSGVNDAVLLSGKCSFFLNLKYLIRAKIVIVHSPLVLSFWYMLSAYFCGCRVYAFVWDFYPVKIYNRYYRFGLKRFLKDRVENALLFLLDKMIIPSEDFRSFYSSFRIEKMKVWPGIDLMHVSDPDCFQDKKSSVIKIVFAGQINETRGLIESISLLEKKIKVPFVIYIASQSVDLREDVILGESVVFLGELGNLELLNLYKECNFGLVSLSPGFNGPAFPSKTFDYLSAGLPILYSGPCLSDYVSMIVDSGVGVNAASLNCIDEKLYRDIIFEFPKKIKKFESLACFDVDDFKRLLFKDVHDEF